MSSRNPTIAEVVGENVKRIRAGNSMEQLAAAGRAFGVSWSSGSISAIERGNFKVTLETLLALSATLNNIENWINGEDDLEFWGPCVPFKELLKTDGPILLTSHSTVEVEEVLSWFGGASSFETRLTKEELNRLSQPLLMNAREMAALRLPEGTRRSDIKTAMNSTIAEQRAAKRVNLDPIELNVWAMKLWGKRLEEKRDEQAGDGATAQKKGRISRVLVQQILDAIGELDGEH